MLKTAVQLNIFVDIAMHFLDSLNEKNCIYLK